MRESTKVNQRKALEAIKVNYGRIEPALKSICLGRTQFYHWLKEDIAFENAYQKVLQEIRITISSKLLKKIATDDPKTLTRVFRITLEKKGVVIT